MVKRRSGSLLHQRRETSGSRFDVPDPVKQDCLHWIPREGPKIRRDGCPGGSGAPGIDAEDAMPEKKTIERARQDEREGKAPTTQAGEFVREEIEHVKEGKHTVKNRKQAIAIGLSKARRAGVKLPPPAKGKAKEQTRRKAASDIEHGKKEGPLRKKAA
jgi:Family of unknown function (DUF6496)